MTSEEKLRHHIHRCFLNYRDGQKFIYETFYDYASSFCINYTEDEEELITMLNNSFLKVFKNIHKFSSSDGDYESSFRIWLRKWIICGIVDHCRNHFKHDLLLDFKHELLFDLHNAWQSFFAIIYPQTNRYSLNEAMRMIQSLSPSNRIILNLTVLEEFSYLQIADCLNISIETATGNVLHAKRQLQNKFLCAASHPEILTIE